MRNHTLALSALMSLARLRGYIVDKKINGKIPFDKLSPADLRAVLVGHLAELDPDSRREVESIAAGGEVGLIEGDIEAA
jgi:hypothetical protein